MDLYFSMARVGHAGMGVDEVTENIEAAVKMVAVKMRMVSSKPREVTLHQASVHL